MSDENIAFLITRLSHREYSERRKAEDALVARGLEAVEPLIAVVEQNYSLACMRATAALGHIGDARAVEPLLKLRQTLETDILQAADAALLVLAHHLAEHPRTTEIPQLIALVRHLRYDSQTQAAAISAAQALETLAHTHPTPALRGSLKWLKSFWAPLPAEFKDAHKAIEDATAQWKDLPLVADAPQTTENLPLPADSRVLGGQGENNSP